MSHKAKRCCGEAYDADPASLLNVSNCTRLKACRLKPPAPRRGRMGERPFEAALFFAKILKIVRFVKSILQHSLRVRLNNRILFSKICYCGVEKKAVILHLIKNGLFLTPKS